MSHTCIRYMDDNTGRDVYIVKTKASNIELVNLTSSSYPKGKTIKNSGYYGMNASWYEEIKVAIFIPVFSILHIRMESLWVPCRSINTVRKIGLAIV